MQNTKSETVCVAVDIVYKDIVVRLDPVNLNFQEKGKKWFELTGVRFNEVKSAVRYSKGNEYCFELAGTSNYRSSNYQ